METTLGPSHPTRFRDLAVTVEFHCNSACRFCIVQEGMNRFTGVPLERFREIVEENAVSRKYDRVLFTGGEVTLEKSLFDFLRVARESGTFRFLRVQTNGRRLADAAFARELVGAGVNELFVSIHGDGPAVHDDITQRPGSFDELVAGLRNLDGLGVRLVTNTVINRRNLTALPGIVDTVRPHGASRMEFWNYLPMEDHADERDLIASVDELLPPLREALARCKAHGIEAITKYLPRCLLGEHADTLDNSQPDTVIVESFWDTFPKFGCLYEAVCEHSDTCLGLHHPYVNKFGWEEARLRPVPRTTPWREKELLSEGRPEGTPAGGAEHHPAWEALVAAVPAAVRARLAGIQLTRNQARFRYGLTGGGLVEVVLAARDDGAQALARSRSFNVSYSNADPRGRDAELHAIVTAVAASVQARDDGALSLDPRKGLPREAVRRPARGRSRPE